MVKRVSRTSVMCQPNLEPNLFRKSAVLSCHQGFGSRFKPIMKKCRHLLSFRPEVLKGNIDLKVVQGLLNYPIAARILGRNISHGNSITVELNFHQILLVRIHFWNNVVLWSLHPILFRLLLLFGDGFPACDDCFLWFKMSELKEDC